MALTGRNEEEKIYNFLMGKIKNACGVSALMGNLSAESGLHSDRLQGDIPYSDRSKEYTAKVDSGEISEYDFVHKGPNGGGYGLAQWTYYSRKQNLYNFAKSNNTSIGDLETGLLFLYQELSTGYKSVLSALKNAKSVRAASDIVLTQFERPKDQSENTKKYRAGIGQSFYDKYAGGKESGNPQNGGSTMKSNLEVVKKVNSWLGKNEVDGSYKEIIDIYNSTGPFPRNTKMLYIWEWCASTWSAVAKALGYTDIMPVEISCYYLIEAAKKMGVWIEADSTVPKPGYAVLYDWDDTGRGDNTGNPDHVGTVVEVYESAGYFVVTEGNYSNSVKKRTVSINGRYIRGFIAPKYDTYNAPASISQDSGKDIKVIAREVIAGAWGIGGARKAALERAGYNYTEVQKLVNQIVNDGAIEQTKPVAQQTKSLIASDKAQKLDKSISGTYKTKTGLYLRHGAGTNKKAMVCMPKDTSVTCYGYYSIFGGAKWYYVVAEVEGVKYTGFCSAAYLTR